MEKHRTGNITKTDETEKIKTDQKHSIPTIMKKKIEKTTTKTDDTHKTKIVRENNNNNKHNK